jgi:predicted RNase H-like HicB family nuclease
MTDPRCEDLLARYEVHILPDEYLGFRAEFPAVPAARGYGATAEDALRSGYDGLRLALDWYLQHGQELPACHAPAVAA